MDKFHSIVNEIYEMFKDYKVSKSEIERRLKLLVFEFKVPEEEARRTIINGLRRDLNISKEALRFPLTKISELEPGKWVSVKAKVIQLWDSTSPSIAQWGIVGDETGTARFVIWTKSSKGKVEEGKNYLFEKVIVDEFGGVKSIKVTSLSEIKDIDEEIEVSEEGGEVEAIGALVSISQNSGLIQICKLCGRFTKAGICKEHGKVEGVEVLRLRGVLDDGEKMFEIEMDENCIRSLTGLDLNAAKKMAFENLDRSIVLLELKRKLLGRYFRVFGELKFRTINVKRAEFFRPKILEEVEKTLEEVKNW
ncbi:MAG: replication protein A [Archaeoglobaceae archaeon]|nr:replication protein A [Archaeoglobaceae archaeon]MDW7989046.1 replication protein A [Archaeoglobaceae archaeon]